ncbi:MAG: phosphoglucomutase/phosphomannomutase family protein [Candidatus Omnitrophota bacterium]|nr:phosphoglucomutase/phosphomannomutase family protein [Candidatus Omnitrophota bacterium]
MEDIKFGTDGWRAVISDTFTFDNVKKVAQAMADYVLTQRSVLSGREFKVVVGYDTRFLSDRYAELTARVMASNDIPVILAELPCPTPSVSYAIKDKNIVGGVVITASHNPARYNGMKYKAYYSGSAGPDITKKMELLLGANPVKCEPMDELKLKGAITVENIVPRHIGFIKRYVGLGLIKKAPLKVIVDSMYGTGNSYISELLEGGKCKVDTIHNTINPSFGGINPEPIMPNLRELALTAKKGKYSVGLATDGDADRLGVVLSDGSPLTGHKVMTLLLLHLLEDRKMRGDVIQTICGTVLIEKICKKYGLKMHETRVGFKYICGLMGKDDILIGGEETGGVAFKNYIPERDGILSGLLILEMIAARRKSLDKIIKDINKEYGTYEYRRFDMRAPDEKKKALMELLRTEPLKKVLDKEVVEVKDYDGYKFILEDRSWFMMRLSGTEPIVRIYAEAPNEKRALAMLEFGKKIVEGL